MWIVAILIALAFNLVGPLIFSAQAMDERERKLERCMSALGGAESRISLLASRARRSFLSIDETGDELIELIQAPGFTPNVQTPGPRPKVG